MTGKAACSPSAAPARIPAGPGRFPSKRDKPHEFTNRPPAEDETSPTFSRGYGQAHNYQGTVSRHSSDWSARPHSAKQERRKLIFQNCSGARWSAHTLSMRFRQERAG